MDRRCLILISTLFVQSLYGASIEVPSTTINGDVSSANTFNGTPLENFSNLTPGDAKVLADLQRIRLNGERFRGEAMQFIQSLPNRLSQGFAQSHQLFQLLAQMFSSAVTDQIQTIQAGGRYLGENAKNLALEGLKRGQNGISAGVEMGEKVLERVRSNGQALLQNGMSYLQSGGSGSASITTRDLSDQITAPFDNNQYTQQFTASLKNNANSVTSQLPNPNQHLEDEDDALFRAQTQDDPEDDLDFEDGLESQKLARRDDKPVTGVLSDEISGVGAAGADMFKNVARFTSGGIRGLLDALSTVLVTTGEVGGHARSAFSSINKSGAGAISAVIDTGGNIVSGGLDKAGSVVGSLRVGGGAAAPPKA